MNKLSEHIEGRNREYQNNGEEMRNAIRILAHRFDELAHGIEYSNPVQVANSARAIGVHTRDLDRLVSRHREIYAALMALVDLEAGQNKPEETAAACQCCGVMVSESDAHGPDNAWLCGECYSSGLVQAAQLLRDNQDSWLKHFGSFDEYDVFEFKAEIMADHPGAVFTFEDVMDLALRLAPSSESAA